MYQALFFSLYGRVGGSNRHENLNPEFPNLLLMMLSLLEECSHFLPVPISFTLQLINLLLILLNLLRFGLYIILIIACFHRIILS